MWQEGGWGRGHPARGAPGALGAGGWPSPGLWAIVDPGRRLGGADAAPRGGWRAHRPPFFARAARRRTPRAATTPTPSPPLPPSASQQPLRLILHNDSTGCTAAAPGRRLERSDLALPRPNTRLEEAVAVVTQCAFFT